MDVPLDVLSWGCNAEGEAGHPGGPSEVPEPRVLEVLRGAGIVAIASANYHTLALSRDGNVWAWGKNGWGQCGVDSVTATVLPTLVKFPSTDRGPVVITQVACGGYHSLALSAAGPVYAWGRNTFGQLGIGSTAQLAAPASIDELTDKGIVQVRAGRSFSVALDERGQVYSWGLGVHGQLGHGNNNNLVLPTVIASLAASSFALLQCGNRHCCALRDDGDVFLWGQGPKEQILIHTPSVIVGGARVKDIRRLECGGLHTLGLTAAGEVCTWGDGTYGQLGLSAHPNKTASAVEPRMVPALQGQKVAFIAAGFYYSFAATEAGDVFAWGCAPRQVQASSRLRLGQAVFGVEASGLPRAIPALSQRGVVALACGYEHFVALVERRVDPGAAPTLQVDLGVALNDRAYSDTTLIVEQREIFCHKVILVYRCPHFARMFASGMQETVPPCRVDVPLYRYTAFYAFLEHLYTDRTDFPTDLCAELMEIAHSYGAPALKAACAERLGSLITLETAANLYAVADQVQAPELRQACLQFILQNFTEVTATEGFMALSKESILDLLKFAGQCNLSFEKRIPMPRRAPKRVRASSSAP